MKRIIKYLLLTLSIFTLVACQSDSSAAQAESKTFAHTLAGNETEMTFEYLPSNQEILVQTSTITMPYETLGFASKEAAEQQMANLGDDYTDLSGVSYSQDFTDNSVTITMTIDFEALDEGEVQSIPNLEGLSLEKQSMDQVETNLLSQGFKLQE